MTWVPSNAGKHNLFSISIKQANQGTACHEDLIHGEITQYFNILNHYGIMQKKKKKILFSNSAVKRKESTWELLAMLSDKGKDLHVV